MSPNLREMPNDIAELCRVCLQLPEDSQYLDLSTIYDEEENLTYGECFTICTQIDLNAGEDVPRHLCKSCGLELQMCYDFYKKVEESKRVIERCQRQTKVHKENAIELLPSSEQPKTPNLKVVEERPMSHIMDEKYIIIDDDGEQQMPEETQDCSISQQENEQRFVETSNMNDEADEMDILNICHAEDKILQVPSHENGSSTSIEVINEENNVSIEVEDHLQIEDYQNLEALEDEETETLQIKCDENIIPIHVTKYKIVESGENEEFVEYDEHYNEEEVNGEEMDEVDEEYAEETNEEDTEDHLKWQENVVTVANKEHLPIVIESDEESEKRKKVSIYKTSRYKNSESQVITNESSQDEAIEDEEKLNEETAKTKPNTGRNNNTDNSSTGRKRHVGSYSCDYCHRVYPNYSRMKTHRRCHEVDRPKFSCSHCGRMYATKQARDCHIQTAHDKSGYTCSICSKVFAIRKSLEIHVRYHTGDFPYACKLCDRKFAQACHLNTHINVKHNKIRFSCDYPNCGKYFTSSSSLRNHEYTHGVMPFECEYCQQGYPAKSKLRVHIQRKHGIDMSSDQLENMHLPSVMIEKDFIKSEFNFEQGIVTNATITPCIPTGVRLPIPPGPPFICEFCGHSSNTKNLLASHRHRKHRRKESPYQCYKCGRLFNCKEAYEKHMNRLSCQHYPEFTCEYCTKRIIGSANYKIHLRFHKKIYPFECQECGKGFMMAIHLKTHVQTKHENKRYICEEPNCGKLFQSHQSLKSHMYVHLGSMPYCCEYCEKMFPNKGRLRWHLRSVHDFEVSFQDLDRMLVAEEITLKAKVKPI